MLVAQTNVALQNRSIKHELPHRRNCDQAKHYLSTSSIVCIVDSIVKLIVTQSTQIDGGKHSLSLHCGNIVKYVKVQSSTSNTLKKNAPKEMTNGERRYYRG